MKTGFNGMLCMVYVAIGAAIFPCVHYKQWTALAVLWAAVAIVEAMERIGHCIIRHIDAASRSDSPAAPAPQNITVSDRTTAD